MNSRYTWLSREEGGDTNDPRDFQFNLGAPVSRRVQSDTRCSYKALALLDGSHNPILAESEDEIDEEDGEEDELHSDEDVGSGSFGSQVGREASRTCSSMPSLSNMPSLEEAEEGVLDAAMKVRRRVKGVASKRRGLLAGGFVAAGVILIGVTITMSPWGPAPRFSRKDLVNLEAASSVQACAGNCALGATVTCSSGMKNCGAVAAQRLVNGHLDSWKEAPYAELKTCNGTAWVELDFGAILRFNKIVLYSQPGDGPGGRIFCGRKIEVQNSADKSWKVVYSTGDDLSPVDNLGRGADMMVGLQTAQHLRVYSSRSNLDEHASFLEVEVFCVSCIGSEASTTPAIVVTPDAAATPAPSPAFAAEAVHGPQGKYWLNGGGDAVSLGNGEPMMWVVYQHDDKFVFASEIHTGKFLSYDSNGTVSFKAYPGVAKVPALKMKPWKSGLLGEVLLMTTTPTALGSYLSPDGSGGVTISSDSGENQLWRIPNFPDLKENCLSGTTSFKNVFKCSDDSLCLGESCCSQKGQATVQCPPNLPVLCYGLHCSGKLYGKDRCCASSADFCSATAGGAARCAAVATCAGFVCPAGQSLKPSPESIECGRQACRDVDAGVCCKVDNVDPLSPVQSKTVFIDKSTSAQRSGFIYPRVEARLHAADQVQLESATFGTFLKVREQPATEARGAFALTSQSNSVCEDGGSVVNCSASSPSHLFEVADILPGAGKGLPVSLKSTRSSKYCTDTGAAIICNTANVSGWHSYFAPAGFNLEDGGDRTLCIKSTKAKKYCRVRDQFSYTRRGKAKLTTSGNSSSYAQCSDMPAAIVCQSGDSGPGTVFDVVSVQGATPASKVHHVNIVTPTSKYCSADETYGVRCNRTAASLGEDFQLVHADSTDKLLLKSSSKGKFCAIRKASIATLRGNVSIRAGNGRICVDHGPGRPMDCDVLDFSEKLLSREDFELVDANDSDHVSIRGNSAGMYCGDTEVGITCDKATPSGGEVFQIVDAGDSSFALKSPRTGKYCGIDDQQIFTMRGSSIAMKSASTGKFCTDSSSANHSQAVTCASTEVGPAEKFAIGDDWSVDQISLRGDVSKKYCRDLPIGVICDQTPVTIPPAGWLRFTLVDALKGTFAIKGTRLSKFCVVKEQSILTFEGEVTFSTAGDVNFSSVTRLGWSDADDEVVISPNQSSFLVINAPQSLDGTLKHIKSMESGKFCSDTVIGLSCTATEAGQAETFSIVDAGDGKVGFQRQNASKYCGVAPESMLKTRGEIHLKTGIGTLCSDAVDRVSCNNVMFSDAFTVKDSPSGKGLVTLQENRDNSYCSDTPNGITCRVKDTVSPLETFELVDAGSRKFALKGTRLGKFCGVRPQTGHDVEGGIPVINRRTGHLCRFHTDGILCDTKPDESIPDQDKLVLTKTAGATMLSTEAGPCAEKLLEHMGTMYNLGITCAPGLSAPGFMFNAVDEDYYSLQSFATGKYCGTVTRSYSHMRGPNIIFKSESTGLVCSDQAGFVRCKPSESVLQWEPFAFEDLGENSTVALRGGRTMAYCSDSPEGFESVQAGMICDSTSVTPSGKFQLVEKGSGKFAIRGSLSGMYCGVRSLPIDSLEGKGIKIISNKTGKRCQDHYGIGGHQDAMDCNVANAGYPVIYDFEPIYRSGFVGIKSAAGKYCSDNGDTGLVCNAKVVERAEEFEVVDTGDGNFALKQGHTGKYCAVAAQPPNMLQGNAIALKASGGGYCSDQLGRILCDKTKFAAWELFEIKQIDYSKTVVTIKGHHLNKFCSDQPTGVTCFADTPGDWEAFVVEAAGAGKVALKGGRLGKYCAVKFAPVLNMRGSAIAFKSASNGKLCTDLPNGVFCRSDKVHTFEQFVVGDLGFGTAISLMGGQQGKYCTDSEAGLICNRNSVGRWESFTIVDAHGGYLALKGGRAGKYCAIQDEPSTHLHGSVTLKRSKTGKYCEDALGKIRCTKVAAKGWEHFTVTNTGFGDVTIFGNRKGKYCADLPDGVVCKETQHSESETFKVVDAGQNKIKLFGHRAKGYCTMKEEPTTRVRGSIQLKSKFTDQYCNFGSDVVTCQGDKSTLSVDLIGDSSVSLKSGNTDKYCSDSDKGITCNAAHKDALEAFQLEDVGSKLALKGSKSGKYCAVKNQTIVEMRGTISMVSVTTGKTCMDQADGVSCIIDSPPYESTLFDVVTIWNGDGGFVGLKDRKGKFCTDEPSGIRCKADKASKWEAFKIHYETPDTFSLIGSRLGKKCGVNGDRIICNLDDEMTNFFLMSWSTPPEAKFQQKGWNPDMQVACDQDVLSDKALFDINGWAPDDVLICDASIGEDEAESFEQGGWSPMQQIICNSENLTAAAKFKPVGWNAESILRCDYDESEKGIFEVGNWTVPWNIKCDADAPPNGTFPDTYKFAQVGWDEDSRIVCDRNSSDGQDMLFEAVNWAPGNVIICDGATPTGSNFMYSFQGWTAEAPIMCDFDNTTDKMTHFEPVGWKPKSVVACSLDAVQGFELGGWQPEQRLICDSDNLTEAAKFLPVGWNVESRIFCESDDINESSKFTPVGPVDVLLKERIVCDAFQNDSDVLSVEFDDSVSPAEKRLICDSDACDSSEAKFKPTGWASEKVLKQTELASHASTFAVVRPHPASPDVALICLDASPPRYVQAHDNNRLYCDGVRPYYFQYERVAWWSSEEGYLKTGDKYLTFLEKGDATTFNSDASRRHEFDRIKVHLTGGYEAVRPLVRGVNLGNWLLLERWMSEDMFLDATGQKYQDSCTALDEYGLMTALGSAAKDRMEAHRGTWITEADIAWIANHGLNAVRIPFGYWIVKPEAPFVEGGFKYLEKVVKWCEDHKVGFLMDFHGLKGSQSGSISSGNCGACGNAACGETWVRFLDYQDFNLEVISIVSMRFANSPMYLGFEVASDVTDSEDAKKCMSFYQKAYDVIRSSNPTAPVYIYQTFNPAAYPWPNLDKVVIDKHFYYKSLFAQRGGSDPRQNFEFARKLLLNSSNMAVVVGEWAKLLLNSSNMAVVVGEWALDDHGIDFGSYTVDAQDAKYKQLAKMQLQAYEQFSTGWYYWSYKTQYGGSTWSYVDMCADGFLPGCTGNYNFTQQPWWKTPSCAFAYLDGACNKTQKTGSPYVTGSWVATSGFTVTGKVFLLDQNGTSVWTMDADKKVYGTIDDAEISLYGLTGLLEGKLIRWSNGELWVKTT